MLIVSLSKCRVNETNERKNVALFKEIYFVLFLFKAVYA